jgi:hypothetical protein
VSQYLPAELAEQLRVKLDLPEPEKPQPGNLTCEQEGEKNFFPRLLVGPWWHYFLVGSITNFEGLK